VKDQQKRYAEPSPKESTNINVNTHNLQDWAKDCWCWRDMISAPFATNGSGGI
jgi:hypothetical protein